MHRRLNETVDIDNSNVLIDATRINVHTACPIVRRLECIRAAISLFPAAL